MTKHIWTGQKQSAIQDALPVRMVLKRKSGYDVEPINRGKILQTEDSQALELDDDKKEQSPGDMLD